MSTKQAEKPKEEKILKKELRTVNIKGKPYVQVHTRIEALHEMYPDIANIQTEIVKETDEMVRMKAIVSIDTHKVNKITGAPIYRVFTGHAEETDDGKNYINKTSMLENCETSAVGRALGMKGIGIEQGFASADEVSKAQNRVDYLTKTIKYLQDKGCKTQREMLDMIKKETGQVWDGLKQSQHRAKLVYKQLTVEKEDDDLPFKTKGDEDGN